MQWALDEICAVGSTWGGQSGVGVVFLGFCSLYLLF